MSMLNLRHLIDDMKANLRVITAFDFSYKGKNYVVVCEDISKQPDEEKPKKYKYYIAKLTFIDYNDESRTLTVLANTKYFDGVSTAQFRAFFGIEYGNNLGDIFQQFYSYFSKSIPEQVPKNLNKTQTISCVKQLNRKKGETDGLYCFNVFRNGKDSKQRQKHRSCYNADKARLLRPTLFNHFKKDSTISFCFTTDKSKEKTDLELIHVFAEREKN